MIEFRKGIISGISVLPSGTDISFVSRVDTHILVNGIIKGYVCGGESPPVFLGFRNFGLPGGIFSEYCKYLGIDYLVIMYNEEEVVIDLSITKESLALDIERRAFIEEQGISCDAILLIMEEAQKGNLKARAVRDWIRVALRDALNSKLDNTELEISVIPYSIDDILLDIPNDNYPIFSNGGTSLQPYISEENPGLYTIISGKTLDIKMIGGNFDNNITINMGDMVTINDVVALSDKELVVNVTSDNVVQSEQNITITRGGVDSFGKKLQFRITDKLVGTGKAGLFVTDFDITSDNSGWGNEWKLDTFGRGVSDVNSFFKVTSANTPSSSTGPQHSSVFGSTSNYMFTERSNPNYGAGIYATAMTSNFAELKSIEFDYHRYGQAMADFTVEILNINDDWVEKFTLTGQKHINGNDQATHVNIDCSSFSAKAIRFVFGETTNYTSDMAIDNIRITSI